VPGRPRVDWLAAWSYYLRLDPWYPGQLGEWDMYRRPPLLEVLRPRARRRTYANVGRAFGVSRQAVHRRAKAEGWKADAARLDASVRARLYTRP
jgi:hypothetical protein